MEKEHLINDDTYDGPTYATHIERAVLGSQSFNPTAITNQLDIGSFTGAVDGDVQGDDDPENSNRKGKGPRLPRSVKVMWALAFFSMVQQMAFAPILLLYCNQQGWTTARSITFYSFTYAAGQIVPIFLGPTLGWAAATQGYKLTLVLNLSLSATGVIMMAALPDKVPFILGYAMAHIQASLRPVRTSLISLATTEEQRTRAVSTQSSCSALGGVLGPLLTMGCARLRPFMFYGISITPYTSVMWIVGLQTALVALSVVLLLPNREVEGFHKFKRDPTVAERVISVPSCVRNRPAAMTIRAVQRAILLAYLTMMLLVNSSAGVYLISFQPFLINEFGFDQHSLSTVFVIIAVLAIIPPMFVGILSTKGVPDRHLMLFGVLLKFGGMVCYALPPMGKWQLIIGFVLVLKSTVLLAVAVQCLFSKMLGTRASGPLMGCLSSGAALGPAIGNIVGGQLLLPLYSTLWMLLFAVPAGVALLLLLFLMAAGKVDPSAQYVKEMHAAELDREPVDTVAEEGTSP